ncbi:unnamed protein product [Phaedon cochleariae]|uniref:CHK kinase-like domain-containing protein n=1 Tax=Phaedon cochleariae TaxID=80249 RepID=A0A9P0DIS6_PHACE|nr:unnamed protein product [Phaedon cochleariae]
MTGSKVIDIHRILKKSIKDEFEIVYQETKSLTTPGEHYGSIMLAVDVKIKFSKDGSEKVLNLVAKLQPANEMLRAAFDVQTTFKKEVLCYTVMIPALIAFQKEFKVPEKKSIANLFPKCYGARFSLDENSNQVDDGAVIILENLKQKGYYTGDRLVGLDFEAAQVILKDLARFHATSIALKKLRPEVFEEKLMACTMPGSGANALPEQFASAHKDGLRDSSKEIPVLKPYLEKIQKVCDRFSGLSKPEPNETWGTICHADFWMSNTMLLNSASGKPISSKIVDLQFAIYASALTDLVFFLFTSVINSVLEKSYETFLKVYYDSFIDTLKDYSIDMSPYSWKSFENELEVAGPVEVCHILMLLKPICTERNIIKNSFEDFEDSDWYRKDLLGPNHRRKLKDTVLALIKKNWL